MEELALNWQLWLPLILISGLLLIVGIIDWAKQGENVRGNRWIWFVIIAFVNTVGPILYFLFGRKKQ